MKKTTALVALAVTLGLIAMAPSSALAGDKPVRSAGDAVMDLGLRLGKAAVIGYGLGELGEELAEKGEERQFRRIGLYGGGTLAFVIMPQIDNAANSVVDGVKGLFGTPPDSPAF